MNIASTSTGSILSSVLAAEYEVLRAAALGEALPLMARSGFTLFLRRGMWGWAKALAAAAASPKEPLDLPSAASTMQVGHSAVVHVLASIATSISHTGLKERISP